MSFYISVLVFVVVIVVLNNSYFVASFTSLIVIYISLLPLKRVAFLQYTKQSG